MMDFLSAERNTGELDVIRRRYIPKVELAPKLERDFDRLARAFQDAVTAQDSEGLGETKEIRATMLDRLDAARGALDPAKVEALRRAINDYYDTANDVSRRLIAGEMGEALVESMSSMQAEQAEVENQIAATTALRPGELENAFTEMVARRDESLRSRAAVYAVILVLVILLSVWLVRGIIRPLDHLREGLGRFGRGDLGEPIAVQGRDELAEVMRHANEMAKSLVRLNESRGRNEWIKAGAAGLAEQLRGELELDAVARHAVTYLARYVGAPAAALYRLDRDELRRAAHVALEPGDEAAISPGFRIGEGLVGEAALAERPVVVADPPAGYLKIRSGLGESAPRAIVLVPLATGERTSGVLELAFFEDVEDRALDLLAVASESIAIAFEVAASRSATRTLLTETQELAQRLTFQDEELRATNEELESQQEEMRQANEELLQQAQELEEQRVAVEEKNGELEQTRHSLEEKAAQLTRVSAYKSQFLTNMSHELRTPLNSMLLLSNLLGENLEGNLTEKQVEYSQTIHSAGKDLLVLINQVLDLAKVEAGKQELHLSPVSLNEIVAHVNSVFVPLGHDKGLSVTVELGSELPKALVTDRQRCMQILNNLLGNAIKFTKAGEVSLRIVRPPAEIRFRRPELDPKRTVALVVSDTGPGIAPDHHARIFAAFEQADLSIGERYGGTGLGLAIVRELVTLLGGEITLESGVGTGSTFTVFLPDEYHVRDDRPSTNVPQEARYLADRDELAHAKSAQQTESRPSSRPNESGSRPAPSLLVIEDDPIFASALSEIIQGQGLGTVVAGNGESGLRLARELLPSGIILDVKLPDLDGWSVMERLKADPQTASIPVHYVSALEGAERALTLGAVGYVTKPASREELVRMVQSLHPKSARPIRILVVEDDAEIAGSLMAKLREEKFVVQRVGSAVGAIEALEEAQFDCMILDLGLPDTDGLDLVTTLTTRDERPSIIVYTGRGLRRAEAQKLEAYAEAIVLKEGASVERLLDEVRLFAHRYSQRRRKKRPVIDLPPVDDELRGKKALVVDDDMRTVYALSALLRGKGLEVFVADTGSSALVELEAHPDLDVVLMDIMMPEMDGYTAMQRIREQPRFDSLPIIALTAKAMKGDEQKCISAGASAYLPKPIDSNRLLATIARYLRAPQ